MKASQQLAEIQMAATIPTPTEIEEIDWFDPATLTVEQMESAATDFKESIFKLLPNGKRREFCRILSESDLNLANLRNAMILLGQKFYDRKQTFYETQSFGIQKQDDNILKTKIKSLRPEVVFVLRLDRGTRGISSDADTLKNIIKKHPDWDTATAYKHAELYSDFDFLRDAICIMQTNKLTIKETRKLKNESKYIRSVITKAPISQQNPYGTELRFKHINLKSSTARDNKYRVQKIRPKGSHQRGASTRSSSASGDGNDDPDPEHSPALLAALWQISEEYLATPRRSTHPCPIPVLTTLALLVTASADKKLESPRIKSALDGLAYRLRPLFKFNPPWRVQWQAENKSEDWCDAILARVWETLHTFAQPGRLNYLIDEAGHTQQETALRSRVHTYVKGKYMWSMWDFIDPASQDAALAKKGRMKYAAWEAAAAPLREDAAQLESLDRHFALLAIPPEPPAHGLLYPEREDREDQDGEEYSSETAYSAARNTLDQHCGLPDLETDDPTLFAAVQAEAADAGTESEVEVDPMVDPLVDALVAELAKKAEAATVSWTLAQADEHNISAGKLAKRLLAWAAARRKNEGTEEDSKKGIRPAKIVDALISKSRKNPRAIAVLRAMLPLMQDDYRYDATIKRINEFLALRDVSATKNLQEAVPTGADILHHVLPTPRPVYLRANFTPEHVVGAPDLDAVVQNGEEDTRIATLIHDAAPDEQAIAPTPIATVVVNDSAGVDGEEPDTVQGDAPIPAGPDIVTVMPDGQVLLIPVSAEVLALNSKRPRRNRLGRYVPRPPPSDDGPPLDGGPPPRYSDLWVAYAYG